jgi:4-diphosphocytidyl-2-C-methyl-D-erythritol kinase
MRVEAPAKLNLHLRVLARETSGYHQLETLYCALELADELELELGGEGVRLEVEGAELGPVERNLVYRAAEAYFEVAALPPAVGIRLRKAIPAGAGLGGGSSDAAATLRALDQLHGNLLGRARLLDIGAWLGSDIPFFASDAVLALAWGRGERILPLATLPRTPVLLAIPPFAIGTVDAFRELAAERGPDAPQPHVHALQHFESWTSLATHAANDFEGVLFERHPLLARVKAALVDAEVTLIETHTARGERQDILG